MKQTLHKNLNYQTPLKNVGVLFLLSSKSVIEVFTSNPKKTMRESFLNMWKNGFILLVYIQTLFVCLVYGSWRDKLTIVLAVISLYSLVLFWKNQIVFWTSIVFLFLWGLSLATLLVLNTLVSIRFFRKIMDEKLGPDFVEIYELNPETVTKALKAVMTTAVLTTGATFLIYTSNALHHTHVMENAHLYVESIGGTAQSPQEKETLFKILTEPNPAIPSWSSIGRE